MTGVLLLLGLFLVLRVLQTAVEFWRLRRRK